MNALLDQLEAKLATVTVKPALMGTTLPITTMICHEVDYGDLERWAAEQFGIRSVEFTESDNDTSHSFNASSRHNPSHEWDQNEVDEVVRRVKESGWLEIWNVDTLLSYFADVGSIPEGNYIVNVSW